MSARSFEGFGEGVVELLELDGGEVVDRGVGALDVEPVHPGSGRGLDVIDVATWALVVDELGLVDPDLRLRERVVVSVADEADRRVDALTDEPVSERDRGVGAAGIGVVSEPCEPGDAFTSAGPERHLEAVQHERGGHARGGAPADDAAECASNTNAT